MLSIDESNSLNLQKTIDKFYNCELSQDLVKNGDIHVLMSNRQPLPIERKSMSQAT